MLLNSRVQAFPCRQETGGGGSCWGPCPQGRSVRPPGLQPVQTGCKESRPAPRGCSGAGTGFGTLWNWGPHLPSSQRGQWTSAGTGIRVAGRGLGEALAGCIPGVGQTASEGKEVAWLGLAKWGHWAPYQSLAHYPLSDTGHPRGCTAQAPPGPDSQEPLPLVSSRALLNARR